MIPIRKRILEILGKQRAATPSELSRSLGVTAADVRHHLRNLEHEGVVKIIGKRPPQGRGRPSQIYSPVDGTDDLQQLLKKLLDLWLKEASQEEQETLLRDLGSRMAGKVPSSRAHITQRLYQVVRRLNALNYQAHWEAHIQAPRIILGHCPYSQIIENYPELCQMDSFMIEELSGKKVVQTEKLVQDNRGIPHCVFVVQEDL